MVGTRDEITSAWRRVGNARDDFFAFQVALLEIATPSKDESLELNEKQGLAIQLIEEMGLLNISEEQALEIFNAAATVLAQLEEITISKPEATSAEIMASLSTEVANLQQKYLSAGIDDELLATGISLYRKLVKKTRPKSEIMLASLLVSAVSSYESFISALISASLKFNPSQMDKYDKPFKYADIVAFRQIDEFVQDAIEKFADNLMSEPMDKWLSFLGIALRQDLAWISSELNEVLQRRHVFVHNGGLVSRRYLENMTKASNLPELNEQLVVRFEYLKLSLDKMAEVVLFLSQAAQFAIHESKEAKTIGFDGEDYNGVIYDLLLDGRFGAIVNAYERLSPLMWTATGREHLRANCLQAKKSLLGIESIRAEVERWDVSLSKRMELAKYALLEDLPKARELLAKLQEVGEVTVIDAATWPILEPLRRASLLESDEDSAKSM